MLELARIIAGFEVVLYIIVVIVIMCVVVVVVINKTKSTSGNNGFAFHIIPHKYDIPSVVVSIEKN